MVVCETFYLLGVKHRNAINNNDPIAYGASCPIRDNAAMIQSIAKG